MSDPKVGRFGFDEDLNVHCKSEVEFHNMSRGEALLVAFWNTRLVPYLNAIKDSIKALGKRVEAMEKDAKAAKENQDKALASALSRIAALEKVNEGKKTPVDKYPGTDPANRGR